MFNLVFVLFISGFTTICLEYITKKFKKYRPSALLNLIARTLQDIFVRIGETIAWLSSFILYVKDLYEYFNRFFLKLYRMLSIMLEKLIDGLREFLVEFGELIIEIALPTLKILVSPTYVIYGYVRKAFVYSLWYTMPTTAFLMNTIYCVYQYYYYNVLFDYESLISFNLTMIFNIVMLFFFANKFI